MQNHITFTKPLSVLSLKLLSHFYLSRAIITNTPIQIWSDPPAQKMAAVRFAPFSLFLSSSVLGGGGSVRLLLFSSSAQPARPSACCTAITASDAIFLLPRRRRLPYSVHYEIGICIRILPFSTHPHRCPVRLSALQGNSFLTASVHALIISLLWDLGHTFDL